MQCEMLKKKEGRQLEYTSGCKKVMTKDMHKRLESHRRVVLEFSLGLQNC